MAGHPFGELLRTLRRRHGLTQAELGRGFCTKAHISAIETGVRAPSGHVVRHLLERLPERRALAEALVASYPPRADWLQAGLALALWGEVAGARTILNALTQLPRGTTGHGARALAWTRFLDGRLDQAVPLLRGGVEHHRRRGHFREAAWALWELGMMLAEAAPGPDALWCFREARRTWTRQGDQADQRFRAIVLHSEARALQRMGAHRRAEEQAAKAARLYRALGDQVGEGHALLEAAHAAHGAGALERGRLLADEARERFLSTGHAPCLGIAELAVAIALLDQGRPGRARRPSAWRGRKRTWPRPGRSWCSSPAPNGLALPSSRAIWPGPGPWWRRPSRRPLPPQNGLTSSAWPRPWGKSRGPRHARSSSGWPGPSPHRGSTTPPCGARRGSACSLAGGVGPPSSIRLARAGGRPGGTLPIRRRPPPCPG